MAGIGGGAFEIPFAIIDENAKVRAEQKERIALQKGHLKVIYGPDDTVVATEYFYERELALRVLALKEKEKALGIDHPSIALDLENLAALYQDHGLHAEAEPLLYRSLAIREKALGAEHLYVAIVLNNLAMVYRAQAKYPEAEPLHQRALAIREKALGPDDPAVATILENYADLLRETGRDTEATEMEARAKAICAKYGKDNHPLCYGINE